MSRVTGDVSGSIFLVADDGCPHSRRFEKRRQPVNRLL
jgi:hypothetical protein